MPRRGTKRTGNFRSCMAFSVASGSVTTSSGNSSATGKSGCSCPRSCGTASAVSSEGVAINGTIKKLADRGFGFILAEDGRDHFFHRNDVDGRRFEELNEGDPVTFEPTTTEKGLRAKAVSPR